MSGLTEHKRDNTLASLTLKVAVIRDDQRILPVDVQPEISKSVWQWTCQTFITVLRALATSDLRLQSFNIFNDTDLQRFSLACDHLNEIDWSDSGLAMS